MASSIYDHKFALWPSLSQLPCGYERSADIKAAMHHDTPNTGQGTHLPKQIPSSSQALWRK